MRVKNSAESISANMVYQPDKALLFGIELIYGSRTLEDGTEGNKKAGCFEVLRFQIVSIKVGLVRLS